MTDITSVKCCFKLFTSVMFHQVCNNEISLTFTHTFMKVYRIRPLVVSLLLIICSVHTNNVFPSDIVSHVYVSSYDVIFHVNKTIRLCQHCISNEIQFQLEEY